MNPISIVCPKCNAQPQQRCRSSMGTEPKVHVKRKQAAEKAGSGG